MDLYTTATTGNTARQTCNHAGCPAVTEVTTTRDGRQWLNVSGDGHTWLPWGPGRTTMAYTDGEGQQALDAAWATHWEGLHDQPEAGQS